MRTGPRTGVLLFTGDVFCDLVFTGVEVPQPGQEAYAEGFAIVPGGAAIRAVAAARLGARSRLVATMGDDPVGTHVRGVLEQESGLDLSETVVRRGYQTPISVAISGPGDRSFISYADPHDIAVPVETADVAAMQVDVTEASSEWARELRGRGVTVVGGVGWDPTGRWSQTLLEQLGAVDVFVPNAVEAMAYTRTHDATAAARALGDRVPLAVVTRGACGLVAVDSEHDEEIDIPGIPVEAVDPTGAGDVFTAALMVADGWDWPLADKLRFATAAAACSVTGVGGASSVSSLEQLECFVAHNTTGPDWDFLKGVLRDRVASVKA